MISYEHLLNPFFYLWLFVCMLQSCVTGFMFARCFKAKVSDIKLALLTILGNSVIPVLAKVLFNEISMFTALAGLVCPTVLCGIYTYGSKIKVAFFFIINLLIECTIEILIHIGIRYLNLQNDVTAYDYNKVIASIIFLLISIPVKSLVAMLWNRIVNKASDSRLSWIFIVFPLAQTLAYVAMTMQYIYWDNYSFSSGKYVFAAMLVFGISDVIFLKFISDFEKKNSLEHELKITEYTIGLEEKHYAEIEAKRYETTKMRHDIKNQILAMQKLISEGKLTDAEEVIDELEKSLNSTVEYKYCSIPIVNAVIDEKALVCRNDNIDFSVDINLTDTDGISKNHLCSIFSNLIDNAVKAVVDVTDRRYIELKAAQKYKNILISCSNSVSDTGKNGKLDPQKSSGYGLKILRDIALQYNGSFDIEIKNGVCEAVVMIVAEGK